jgi:hypothetical protein
MTLRSRIAALERHAGARRGDKPLAIIEVDGGTVTRVVVASSASGWRWADVPADSDLRRFRVVQVLGPTSSLSSLHGGHCDPRNAHAPDSDCKGPA